MACPGGREERAWLAACLDAAQGGAGDRSGLLPRDTTLVRLAGDPRRFVVGLGDPAADELRAVYVVVTSPELLQALGADAPLREWLGAGDAPSTGPAVAWCCAEGGSPRSWGAWRRVVGSLADDRRGLKRHAEDDATAVQVGGVESVATSPAPVDAAR